MFSACSSSLLIVTLIAVHTTKDKTKPIQAFTSSIGNHSKRMANVTKVITIVPKNRTFQKNIDRFFINLSVRKAICATDIMTAKINNCKSVAIENP